MTTEPKLPPPPAKFTFSNACKNEFEVYGLQCFEAGRQQGMAQERALHGLAESSREIEAVPQWQPIETAPKDLFPRLYLVGEYCLQGFVDATGRLMVQSEISPHWRRMRGNPTHWMPLPEPPKA